MVYFYVLTRLIEPADFKNNHDFSYAFLSKTGNSQKSKFEVSKVKLGFYKIPEGQKLNHFSSNFLKRDTR